MSKPRIVIDAGHGGKDSGALGPQGLREKDVVLDVALMLGMMVSQWGSVIYTRTDDAFVELDRRATLANDAQGDAFISLHCNSGGPGSGDGFEIFTSPGVSPSDRLATDIFSAYAEQFPFKRKRMDLSDGDPDKEARFTVLMRTHCRAVLMELEFIHTPEGERWLGSQTHQAECARALDAGLRRHFGKTAAAVAETPDLKADLIAKAGEILSLANRLP